MGKNQLEVDIKVPNQTRYLSLIGKIGEDIAKELGKGPGDGGALAYHLNMVLTEAMSNAIKYGRQGESDAMVHISISFCPEKICIRVYDNGQGFDINTIPTPDFDMLEDRGRGIFIIKSLMDSVRYRKLRCKNVLEMSKKLG